MRLTLTICTLLHSEALAMSLQQLLSSERYLLTQHQTKETFLNFVEQRKQQLDCLVLEDGSDLVPLVNAMYEQGTLLPLVILKADSEPTKDLATPTLSPEPYSNEERQTKPTQTPDNPSKQLTSEKGIGFYHAAAVFVPTSELSDIAQRIDEAISHFLKLSSTNISDEASSQIDAIKEENALLKQQRRLAEKLRERLGYLGVYYKRNPQNFFRNLPAPKRQEFIEQLKLEYRQIVLEYFRSAIDLNPKIDEFVNIAFFADISVTYIVEIHMELMDELSKHLKLEGRNDDVLLDYRLTLIDVIAHLCEMYRRSLPKDT